MAEHELLDNIKHKNLRIIRQYGAEFGDNLSYARVFVPELTQAQACYPIFFVKNAEEQLEPVALFGFEQGENLFLQNSDWQANYIPWSIQRAPFLIGFQEPIAGGGEPEPVVYVDMQHPRVSDSEGQSVFLPHGGQSDYLQYISQLLASIHQGHQNNQDFVRTLSEYNLIEAAQLEVELDNHKKYKMGDLFAISEEKLAALKADELYKLKQSGYLSAIYMVIASTAQLSELIRRKNQTVKNGS
ncbi:SapC family protein [Gayadomonas joobiniege]|uniref:SapC family protein n=1 Tax=Gayadomonas joobiniege TaxID=1234606 RepID=UPI0003662201|nr:SapC family protein [Gayadomonas joobiniege]